MFFVIDIGSRRVHIAGISNQASGAWMTQLAPNLTDCFDGFLHGTRHLILDRDPLYTHAFHSTLAEAGVNVVRLPAWSPDLNAFAERFVLSVKSECLDRQPGGSLNWARSCFGTRRVELDGRTHVGRAQRDLDLAGMGRH